MTITESQRITISQLWNKVCKDRGWKSGDRALRLATLGKILGRELTTMDDIGRLAECTTVMAELTVMLGVSVEAGLEATDPGRNRKRNARWLIENEVLPCLALYPLDAPMGRSGAENFARKVLEGKSRYRKTDRPESEPCLADFDERTLQQILWTLSARLNDKRKEAGHSGHQMRTAAGVPCFCATFCRKKVVLNDGVVLPVIPAGNDVKTVAAEFAGGDPDWNV